MSIPSSETTVAATSLLTRGVVQVTAAAVAVLAMAYNSRLLMMTSSLDVPMIPRESLPADDLGDEWATAALVLD